MKPIVEILQLLLDNFDKYFYDEKTKKGSMGMCDMLLDMAFDGLIYFTECQEAREYIISNTPEHMILNNRQNKWAFKPGLKEPRIKWLEEEIKMLSD